METVEVSKRFVAMFTVVILLVGIGFGMILNMGMQTEKECPDLICPDCIYYGDDYSSILENISWKVNFTKDQQDDGFLLMIANIQHLEDRIDELEVDLKWVDYWQHWMIYLLHDIKNDTLDINLGQIPQYPRDHITIVNYTENTSLQIEYYDNLFGQNFTSLVFTIENWTELMDWSYSIGDARLYPNQRMMILLIGINMAYYKETGTWLGD